MPKIFLSLTANSTPIPSPLAFAMCRASKRLCRKPIASSSAAGNSCASNFPVSRRPLLAKIYKSYSFSLIPAIGRMVTGEAEPYRYLVESIRQFPAPDDFAAMIERAGFQRVGFTRLTGGVVAIHSGWKL